MTPYSPPRNPLDTGRFQRIARTFSGDHLLTVDATTFTCSYNPTTRVIRIPANSDQLDAEHQDVVEGELDHEMLHARAEQRAIDRRTAGEQVDLPSEAMTGLPDAKRRQLFNVVKDVADECDGAREYVGISRHLDAMNDHCLGKLREQQRKGELSPWRQVTCGAILSARGKPVDWLPTDVQQLVRELAPELGRAQFCTDAKEQLELVASMWAKLEQLAKGSKDEEQDDASGKGSGGTPGEEAPSGGSGNPSSQQPAQDGEKKPSAQQAAAAAMSAKEDLDDLGELTKQSITEFSKQYAATTRRIHIPCPEVLKHDRIITATPGTSADYLRLLDEVRPAVSALRAKLLTLLRARAACRVELDKDEGLLDHGQLHRLFGGVVDRNIFYSEEQGQTLSVAVSILRDFSGSMGGDKAVLEQLACLAVAEALAQLRVSTEVIGFCSTGLSCDGSRKLYNRFRPLLYTVFKTFAEDYRHVKLRLADEAQSHIRGCNSDADALMFAARRLATQKQTRKILLVLSDGWPADDGDDDLLLQATKDNVQKISRAGIECVGIGIASDAVKEIYPEHLVVKNIVELAPQLFRVLKGLLVGRNKSKRRAA